MRAAQCVSVKTYFVLVGYRHCSELGRLVLNTSFPLVLFSVHVEVRRDCSSVQFMRCGRGFVC